MPGGNSSHCKPPPTIWPDGTQALDHPLHSELKRPLYSTDARAPPCETATRPSQRRLTPNCTVTRLHSLNYQFRTIQGNTFAPKIDCGVSRPRGRTRDGMSLPTTRQTALFLAVDICRPPPHPEAIKSRTLLRMSYVQGCKWQIFRLTLACHERSNSQRGPTLCCDECTITAHRLPHVQLRSVIADDYTASLGVDDA